MAPACTFAPAASRNSKRPSRRRLRAGPDQVRDFFAAGTQCKRRTNRPPLSLSLSLCLSLSLFLAAGPQRNTGWTIPRWRRLGRAQRPARCWLLSLCLQGRVCRQVCVQSLPASQGREPLHSDPSPLVSLGSPCVRKGLLWSKNCASSVFSMAAKPSRLAAQSRDMPPAMAI